MKSSLVGGCTTRSVLTYVKLEGAFLKHFSLNEILGLSWVSLSEEAKVLFLVTKTLKSKPVVVTTVGLKTENLKVNSKKKGLLTLIWL